MKIKALKAIMLSLLCMFCYTQTTHAGCNAAGDEPVNLTIIFPANKVYGITDTDTEMTATLIVRKESDNSEVASIDKTVYLATTSTGKDKEVDVTITYSTDSGSCSATETFKYTVAKVTSVTASKTYAYINDEVVFTVGTEPAGYYEVAYISDSAGSVVTEYNDETGTVGIAFNTFGEHSIEFSSSGGFSSANCDVLICGWTCSEPNFAYVNTGVIINDGDDSDLTDKNYKVINTTIGNGAITLSSQVKVENYQVFLVKHNDLEDSSEISVIKSEKKVTWFWVGPDYSLPTKSEYSASCTGDGYLTVQGSIDAGSGTASSVTSGSVKSTYSGPGDWTKTWSVGMDGSCDASSTHSMNVALSPEGFEFGGSTGSSGSTAYTCTKHYDVIYTSGLIEFAASTITIRSLCSGSGSSVAKAKSLDLNAWSKSKVSGYANASIDFAQAPRAKE